MKLTHKLRSNKSGFTLLEIIIVIIIVGVLISLALPRFFETINFARATEAFNAIGVAKRAADRCALMAGAMTGTPNYANCEDWAQIGIEDPGTSPGANFAYGTGGVFTAPNLVFTADRVGDATSSITVTYNTVAGTITRTGTGDYSGVQ